MPSVNINSKDFKDLGISLKDFLKIVKNSGDNKNEEPIIIKKKKKRRNRRNKKLKKIGQLLNNKPNFGHQNQIGGGGGGIGGTSYNALAQQRSPPAVTTVVNTPPTGGQIGGQTGGQTGGQIGGQTGGQTEHYNKLYELLHGSITDRIDDLGNKIDDVNKDIIYGVNYLGKKLKDDKKMIEDKKDDKKMIEDIKDDNIGFPTSSYRNPLSNPTQLILKNTQSLSDQKGGSFRNSPQSNTLERFGVSPINGNATQNIYNNESEPSYNTSDNYRTDDNQYESDATINREFEAQQENEPIDYVEDYPNIQENYEVDEGILNGAINDPLSNSQIQSDTVNDGKLPNLGDYSEIMRAYDMVYGHYNDLDKEIESIKKQYYDDDTEDEKIVKNKKVSSQSSSTDSDERIKIQLQKEKEEEDERLAQQLQKEKEEAEAARLQKAQKEENDAREKAELWFSSGVRPRGKLSKRVNEIYNELKNKSPLVAESLQKLNTPTNINSKLVSEDDEEEDDDIFKGFKNSKILRNKDDEPDDNDIFKGFKNSKILRNGKIVEENKDDEPDDKPKKMTKTEALAKARIAKAEKAEQKKKKGTR